MAISGSISTVFPEPPPIIPAAPTFGAITVGVNEGDVDVVVNVPTLDTLAVPLVIPHLVKSITIFSSQQPMPTDPAILFSEPRNNIKVQTLSFAVPPITVTFNLTGTIPGANLYLAAVAQN
jgi:hypothetical protein